MDFFSFTLGVFLTVVAVLALRSEYVSGKLSDWADYLNANGPMKK